MRRLQAGAQLARDEARHHALALECPSEAGLELDSNDRVERCLLGRAPRVPRRRRLQRGA
jgi:hypothetical protein